MKWLVQPRAPLEGAYPSGHICAAWVGGGEVPGADPARVELERALEAAGPGERAPVWNLPTAAAQLPTGALRSGPGPGIVVTGQQPGFLGGPLLTLHKIATALAVARRRTAAGRPTVAVFWSGDADDDLAEALGPVGWNAQDGLVRSPARKRLEDPATARGILGRFGPEVWSSGLTDAVPGTGGDLGTSVFRVLDEARQAGASWGEAQALLLGRIFDGQPLVVVRGDDPDLHALAAPFTTELAARRMELADLARARGAELAAAGFAAQIAERSLARPLFVAEGGQRRILDPEEAAPPALLRPGVMLRSLVQDWLLGPAAVVVGPGELAYLRQLDPLYAAVDLPRSPLVPRLSGWVIPAGLPEAATAPEADPGRDAARAVEWAAADLAATGESLARRLREDVGLESARAQAMADARVKRLGKGVVAMYRDALARAQRDGGDVPPWVRPLGERQERRLGLLAAVAAWDRPFLAAVREAADRHLEAGLSGEWQEWLLLVSEGTDA